MSHGVCNSACYRRGLRYRVVPFGPSSNPDDTFPRASRRTEIANFAGCLIVNILIIVGFFVALYLAMRAAGDIISEQNR